MKIVHIMNWYIPGMGYQENFLPAEQQKLGHEVEILTSDRIPMFSGYERHIGTLLGNRIVGAGVSEDNGVRIHRLETVIEMRNGGIILLRGVKEALKEIQPHIVQVHGAFVPLAIQVLADSSRAGYRVFIDDHSNEDNFHIDTLPRHAYISFFKVFYDIYGNRVECWMPVTHSSRSILKSVLTISESEMEMLPLGANTRIFIKSEDLRQQCRRELGIDKGTILLISSGKFHELKDLDILFMSFQELIKSGADARLLLLGNGPTDYMRKLSDISKSLGIVDRIIWRDFVPNRELPKYYNAADIGVWPGDHSITVIEAIAIGLPTIVSSSIQAYEILFENGAAMGFSRGDARDLSRRLIEIASDSDLRLTLSNNSLELVKKKLSWEAIARKSIEIYQKEN